eukprot:112656_1
MKSFVAVSSVVVLIAAQFICETQGLAMRSVTLNSKETGGTKLKDAKTKGSGRWESLLANMKKIPGASNENAVQKLKQELRNVGLEQKNEGPGDCPKRKCDPVMQPQGCCNGYRCKPLPVNSHYKGVCIPTRPPGHNK